MIGQCPVCLYAGSLVPEAVVAAVSAQGLTDELARRAWWAMEDAGNARRMLVRPTIVDGDMGPVLARYLVEHLPFETEPEKMMETVRLVLQRELVDDAAAEMPRCNEALAALRRSAR